MIWLSAMIMMSLPVFRGLYSRFPPLCEALLIYHILKLFSSPFLQEFSKFFRLFREKRAGRAAASFVHVQQLRELLPAGDHRHVFARDHAREDRQCEIDRHRDEDRGAQRQQQGHPARAERAA